jgi:hypothetical protein
VINVSRSLSHSFALACDLISMNVYIRSYIISSNNNLSYSIIIELIRIYGINLPLK